MKQYFFGLKVKKPDLDLHISHANVIEIYIQSNIPIKYWKHI